MTSRPLPAIVFDGVIDVSHHNGAIDWPAVAAAGIVLAFIKATQGTGFVDPNFERNRDAAVKAGVLAVPYHFIDTSEPDDQADHFLDVTDLAAGQPAMIDWESTATVSDVVAFGRALVDSAQRDPVAYYGFAQLMQATPDLSRWPAAGIPARQQFRALRHPRRARPASAAGPARRLERRAAAVRLPPVHAGRPDRRHRDASRPLDLGRHIGRSEGVVRHRRAACGKPRAGHPAASATRPSRAASCRNPPPLSWPGPRALAMPPAGLALGRPTAISWQPPSSSATSPASSRR